MTDYDAFHYQVRFTILIALFWAFIFFRAYELSGDIWTKLSFIEIFVLSLLGITFADFVSGFGHWTMDTWGTSETPLIGELVDDFRVHHTQPLKILERTYAARNAEAATLVTVACGTMRYFNLFESYTRFQFFMLVAGVAVSFINEVHMYAHLSTTKQPVPKFVQLLQASGLILNAEKHNRHHHLEHDSDYCILTGWLNAPLQAVGFWRRAEAAIVSVLGLVNHRNDEKHH